MPMPRTILIRDLDDDVYEASSRHAAEVGMTVRSSCAGGPCSTTPGSWPGAGG
jgi:glutaminase